MSPDEDRRRILLHDLHQLFNKWAPDVLVALSSGPLPYMSLMRAVKTSTVTPDYGPLERDVATDGTLHQTFDRLEERGLILCHRTPTFPRRTTYSLTPPARELMETIGPIVEWAARNKEILERVTKS